MGDLSRAPLMAISNETQHIISILLNPPKFITASNGLFRDWRGLAHICSMNGENLPNIASDPDPSGCILSIAKKKFQDFTLLNLKEALEKIERWDVVNDSLACLEKDAEVYLRRLEKSQDTAEQNNFAAEAEILTIDDLFRNEQGQEHQHYDAFLLYADEDADFANEMVENLEKQNLKLCLKERDLVAGITFEHEAVMRLISERCNRLIIIISPDFLKSSANKFFLNFAQASGINKNQERKIIPCIYKVCEFPPQIAYFSKIYYNKLTPEFFWKKLIFSTKVIANNNSVQNTNKSIKIQEKNIAPESTSSCDNESIKKCTVEEKSSEEMSKCTKPMKSRLPFSFIKKEKSEAKETSKDESEVSDIPSLPSLDSLDSLSSIAIVKNETKKTKKKKKFVGHYVKKLQSLLEKSS